MRWIGAGSAHERIVDMAKAMGMIGLLSSLMVIAHQHHQQKALRQLAQNAAMQTGSITQVSNEKCPDGEKPSGGFVRKGCGKPRN